MESPNSPTLVSRIRTHRLASTFTLLGTLTIGILAGSVLTRDVGAKESAQHLDTSDARPLVVPNPVTLSNGFSQIVKQVGPAVVNINTEELRQAARPPASTEDAALQRGPPVATTDRLKVVTTISSLRETCRTSSTASSAAKNPGGDDSDGRRQPRPRRTSARR